MKKKKATIACVTLLVAAQLTACGSEANTSASTQNGAGAESSTEGGTKVSGGSSVFTGELEQNVTIRVLENDTAISNTMTQYKQLADKFTWLVDGTSSSTSLTGGFSIVSITAFF